MMILILVNKHQDIYPNDKDIQNCSTLLIKNWQRESIKKAKMVKEVPDSIKIKNIVISLNKKN